MTITVQSAYNARLNGLYSCQRGLTPRKGATKAVRGRFHLPETMRVLYISNSYRSGEWLSNAFASDSSTQIELHEACGASEGLTALRESVFDAVIVAHAPGELDAADFIAGFHSGGINAPTIVVGDDFDPEFKSRCYQAGADDCLCIHTTTVRNLLWAMTRAMKRFHLEEENSQLQKERKQILAREKDEAIKMYQEQVSVSQTIKTLCLKREERKNGLCAPHSAAPESFVNLYKEILKTYVIMGAGSLSRDLAAIAETLVENNISARQVMEIHLDTLNLLIEELGGRSTRHVMARADELILELLVHLSECYRLSTAGGASD